MIELNAKEISKFITKIDIRNQKECWNWLASTWSSGYGQYCFSKDGKTHSVSTHRTSFTIFNGVIPKGLQINHTCDNKICVNPGHLYAGTHKDNMRDMFERGRNPNRSGILIGEHNPKSKLTENDVIRIRSSFNGKEKSQAELAREFNVSPFNIHSIVHNRSWKHI